MGRPRQAKPAHPRVSGENEALEAIATAQGGSSPRERGKHLREIEDALTARLIPA